MRRDRYKKTSKVKKEELKKKYDALKKGEKPGKSKKKGFPVILVILAILVIGFAALSITGIISGVTL